MIKKVFILLTLLAAGVSVAGENVFSVRGEEVMLNEQVVKIIGLRCSNALVSEATTRQLIDIRDFFLN